MYRYTVTNNTLLTPSVRSLTLARDPSSAPMRFEPGQYAAISLRDRLRPTTFRCFSIASSPSDRDILQFCARVNGTYTNALERLMPGDRVDVRGPFGSFVLHEDEQSALVLFAGGIGITPFMSMIRYATDMQLEIPIRLIFSCRDQNDVPFLDELRELLARNPNFRVTFSVTSGPTDRLAGLDVVSGRIDATSIGKLGLSFGARGETYMICGPAAFIAAMRDLLIAGGTAPEQVHSEAFSQGAKNQSEKLLRWPAHMYGLSGALMLLLGFFVAASDVTKTLPDLQADAYTVADDADTLQITATNTADRLAAIPPQVSTDITQPPIVKTVRTTAAPVVPVTQPVVTQPAPVVVATPKPTQTTQTTTSRPHTRRS